MIMKALTQVFTACLFTLCAAFSPMLLAADRGEQKQVFGDYEVHYIGLNSSFLPPEAAEAYGITRSRALGYISVSILHNEDGSDMPVAVSGNVTGKIRNLVGQSRELEFQEIKETNAVYYITTFRFDDEDMYNIDLKVTPEGQSRTFDVKFSQRFYEE
jgi:hypothetical protein